MFENDVLFSNDTGILGKRNSEFSQQESNQECLFKVRKFPSTFLRIFSVLRSMRNERNHHYLMALARKPVDECDVRNLLTHQKRTASGPDEFPYWLWRDYSHHLAPVITKVFNCSLKHQTVPFLWKLANVSPIPKESPLTEQQFRPISLTNIIMRVFERLVCKQELSPILQSAIGPDQFAYKKGHNTTMALIKCQYFWLQKLDGDADFVRAFSFDFSKSFDSVSHRVLCKTIVSYDINLYIKNWIMSFLCDRQQRVVVNGVVTSVLNINRGVPQGAVLGPSLSSIMVNDIKPVIPPV